MVLVKEKLAWTLCWHHKTDADRVLGRYSRVTAERAREKERDAVVGGWWACQAARCDVYMDGWLAPQMVRKAIQSAKIWLAQDRFPAGEKRGAATLGLYRYLR